MACNQITKRLAPLAVLAVLLYAPPSTLEGYLGTLTGGRVTALPCLFRPWLRFLFGLNCLRGLNVLLNYLAQNNWRLSSSPPSSRWDWPREVAVVTGGCGGFGLSLVQGLTARGVRVAVLDIVGPEAVPGAIKENPRAAYFQCDVTSLASVQDTAAAVRKHFDGQDPTILVNNAGIANMNSILEVQEAALRRVVSVNLVSMWFTTQQFLPAMLRQNKGHIFTVASLASFVAIPNSVEYSATKAGALAFHEGLACEIKHMHKARGVVTSVVHPNFAKTGMTTPHAGSIEKTQKMLTVEDVTGPMLKQIFSGRGGQLVVPTHLTFLTGLRGWPSWIQESLRDVLGRNHWGAPV